MIKVRVCNGGSMMTFVGNFDVPLAIGSRIAESVLESNPGYENVEVDPVDQWTAPDWYDGFSKVEALSIKHEDVVFFEIAEVGGEYDRRHQETYKDNKKQLDQLFADLEEAKKDKTWVRHDDISRMYAEYDEIKRWGLRFDEHGFDTQTYSFDDRGYDVTAVATYGDEYNDLRDQFKQKLYKFGSGKRSGLLQI